MNLPFLGVARPLHRAKELALSAPFQRFLARARLDSDKGGRGRPRSRAGLRRLLGRRSISCAVLVQEREHRLRDLLRLFGEHGVAGVFDFDKRHTVAEFGFEGAAVFGECDGVL